MNFHFAVTLDLFGSEISTNAATVFNAGIKGRLHETDIDDDHQLHNDVYPVLVAEGANFVMQDKPAVSAINARLVDDYVRECEDVVAAWNKVIAGHGIDFELRLPHRAFNRAQGGFAGLHVTPAGDMLDAQAWLARRDEFLAGAEDLEYLLSLMRPSTTVGQFASWIAPPRHGVGGKPGDYEYVKIAV